MPDDYGREFLYCHRDYFGNDPAIRAATRDSTEVLYPCGHTLDFGSVSLFFQLTAPESCPLCASDDTTD